MAEILLVVQGKYFFLKKPMFMKANEKIFDHGTFDDQVLTCPKCGWKGTGTNANVADFYGIGKFKEVTCPNCDEFLGNLPRENSFGISIKSDRDSQRG